MNLRVSLRFPQKLVQRVKRLHHRAVTPNVIPLVWSSQRPCRWPQSSFSQRKGQQIVARQKVEPKDANSQP